MAYNLPPPGGSDDPYQVDFTSPTNPYGTPPAPPPAADYRQDGQVWDNPAPPAPVVRGYGTAGPPTGAYPSPGSYHGMGAGYPPPVGYGWGGSTAENGKGTGALVLGILALVVCFAPVVGTALSVVGIILGHQGRRAADAGRANNRGIATAGFVLGIVGTVLSLLGLLGVVASMLNG
ncbi:MAG: DUF4190 domain-containing protein [Beutenbergiaceae bacterium]